MLYLCISCVLLVCAVMCCVHQQAALHCVVLHRLMCAAVLCAVHAVLCCAACAAHALAYI